MDYVIYAMMTIPFAEIVGNARRKRNGLQVTETLVIVPNEVQVYGRYIKYGRWQIFSLLSCRPLVKKEYKTKEEAIKIAQKLDRIYNKFFPLFYEYPDMDLLSVCRYSIPNGIEIYEHFRSDL